MIMLRVGRTAQTYQLSLLRCFCLSQSSFQNPQLHSLKMSPQTPLDFNSGPMVWIDCEMTGLDPRRDKILEIAVSTSTGYLLVAVLETHLRVQVLITNGNLELVDERGIQFVIGTDKAVLNS
jgi:oligoribonuclease (3'-5' exoribonuclease)